MYMSRAKSRIYWPNTPGSKWGGGVTQVLSGSMIRKRREGPTMGKRLALIRCQAKGVSPTCYNSLDPQISAPRCLNFGFHKMSEQNMPCKLEVAYFLGEGNACLIYLITTSRKNTLWTTNKQQEFKTAAFFREC